MKKHLAIYFIATSNYKQGFEHFKKSLHLFYPEMKKTVIVLSDGLKEWDGVEENDITYKVFKIDHFCWPIITLFKMKYILDYQIDCDYVAYCNGNLQFNPSFDFSTINNVIDLNKFNASRHSYYLIDTFDDMNGHIYDKGISPNSQAHIANPYIYVQAAFFMGPSSIVYGMCKDVCDMCEIDLKKNIIPNYHDESYLNRWIENNKNTPYVVYPPKKLLYPIMDNKYPFGLINSFTKDRYIQK